MTETMPAEAPLADGENRLTVERLFTTEGVHPYEMFDWERRDVVQTNWKTGETIFEQRGVEFPATWSMTATTIVTTKYMRGALGSEQREWSLKQVIDRVVDTYVAAAATHGYMDTTNANILGDEMRYMLVAQMFSFNSPVWFNVGTQSPQQVSACFILSVDDSMDSILNWYREEGFIFKGGSGAGVNVSRIRSSKELLSSGGNASGPVSFMRGADASAGTIKSGGATRRAAKMVVLDVDHPDIVEFVEVKAREEEKIRALRDAGFDMDLGGKDINSVQYQNANNSVRVSDEFMRAVEDGTEFGLRSRSTGEVIETVDARDLFHKIAVAAWECADPGMQYDDTINAWHTNPETGRITASNPCSEYMSLDNSSCNLASLNLMKFLAPDGTFDAALFAKAVEIVITAMEVSISFADFPTEAIGQTTVDYRQLGIGFANLGAMLMAMGLAYDSGEGRALAASITSLMTGVSYKRSAQIAGVVGPYNGYARNAEAHQKVMRKHARATEALVAAVNGGANDYIDGTIVTATPAAAPVAALALDAWVDGYEIGKVNGYRNAQASVLAPTGTIGFMMDCDTTGIEPDFSLVKFKKMVDGASLEIVNQMVPSALATLGYDEQTAAGIVDYIKANNGNVVGAPGLAIEHYPVFDCAQGAERQISAMGHIRMMAACQPMLSGAISKTCNVPNSATVEEIGDIYMESWRLGLKAQAVYRDACKAFQPLQDKKADDIATPATGEAETAVVEKVVERIVEVEKIVEKPVRKRLPKSRQSTTTSFTVGGAEGYMTAGRYEDGSLGEIFMKMGKQGSTLAGVMDAFSIAVSIGLQHGVPLETYLSKFTNLKFEPSGFTDDPDIRMSQSILDYAFRRLALDHLPREVREQFALYSAAEREADLDANPAYGGTATAVTPTEVVAGEPGTEKAAPSEEVAPSLKIETPLCLTCGTPTVPSGACFACPGCGSTTGCS